MLFHLMNSNYLKQKIKDLFNSYVVQFDDEFVESMNDGLKNLLDSFKIVNTARTYHYLPIYFASNKESMIRYKNLQLSTKAEINPKTEKIEFKQQSDFNEKEITNAINEMIKAISEAVVEEKGATQLILEKKEKVQVAEAVMLIKKFHSILHLLEEN